MAVLTVVTGDGDIITLPISPAVSILNTLMKNGIAIQHKCGGRAQCGTCRLKLVKGGGSVGPISERERIRLEAVGAPADYRLACQLYAFGDITVEIPRRDKQVLTEE